MKFARLLLSFLCFSFISIMSYPVWPQTVTLAGDITGDGVVDGRDALKIMRTIAGLETIREADIPKGDVYPVPGTEGRRIGDGRLTREDAEMILKQYVGSIPPGTFSGDYSQSAPVIDNFYPRSGSAGTSVTLEGKNFLASYPDENVVFFGGIAAPVRAISGTRITTEVPAGASSSLIRVWTPGGIANSDSVFCITQPCQGKLILGKGINPSDFTIVSAYGESKVNSNGSFTAPAVMDELTFLGAASSSSSNNTYLSFLFPTTSSSAPGIVIDSLSTAKALVFIHPFFLTYDTTTAKMLFDLMDTLPEIKKLAEVIERRYPAGANGLEDGDVLVAWEAAVTAFIKVMPPKLITPIGNGPIKALESFSAKAKTQPPLEYGSNSYPSLAMPFDDGDKNPVNIYPVDREYLKASYDPEGRYIKMSLFSEYSPLDWTVGLFQVDPESMPLGVNTPFTDIRSKGLRHLNYKRSTLVAANQWTARIDVGGYFTTLALTSLLPEGKSFNLPSNEEGVYVLRAASGGLRDYQGWDNNAIMTTPNGPELAISALLENLSVSLIDLWGVFIGGDRTFMQKTILKSIQAGMTALTRENFSAILEGSDDAKVKSLLVLLVDLGEGIRLASIEQGASDAKEKVLSTFKTAISKSLGILETLRVISCVGKVAERITGLMGYLLNPLGMELSPGPTPLETFLVVVGDPFGPVLTGFEPQRGGEGTEVVITGKRFAPNFKENQVFFGDQEAEIISGSLTELKVKVPFGNQTLTKDKKVSIYVETRASQQRAAFKDQFTIVRGPAVASMTPSWGFAPNPNSPKPQYPDFAGTDIQLLGTKMTALEGEQPYQLFFGDLDAQIIQSTIDSILFIVPAGAKPGEYKVSLYDPRSRTKTAPLVFRVAGPPLITEVTPSSAQAGQFIEIYGKELLGANIFVNNLAVDVIYKSDTRIQFLMPSYGLEGDVLNITAVSPAGKSDGKTIKRLAGVQVAQLPVLPMGYSLTVRTGKIGLEKDGNLSLDEITQFLNKQLDLTTWDDKNLKTMQVWTQYKDENGNTKMVKTNEFEDTPARENNGPSGHETHEIWRRDRLLDGSTNEYIVQTIDLDATKEQMEEADYLIFNSSNPAAYDGKSFKNTIDCLVNEPIESNGFTLTPQTELTIPNNIYLGVEGGITLSDGCKVHLGRVGMRKSLDIKASNAIVYSGTFSSADSDAIRIENGFGNIIGNQDIGDATSVWVLYSGGNGIAVQGGGKNTLRADIRDCPSFGLYSETTENNLYKTIVIENCTKGGVYSKDEKYSTWANTKIRGGDYGIFFDNTIGNSISTGCSIEKCQGAGLTIQGGYLNLIGSIYANYSSMITINQCGQAGILLSQTESNLLCNIQIEGCQGNALQLEDNASENNLKNITLCDSANGLLLTGNGTLLNVFDSIYAGIQVINSDKWVRKGNRNAGVIVQNGANNNQFKNMVSMANRGHGVLIEGNETHTNVFESNYIGCKYIFTLYQMDKNSIGNGGDGVLIQKGAHHNTFWKSYIIGSGGNGITIQDESTDNNIIEDCHSGSDTIRYASTPVLKPNRGYGILVWKKANGTILHGNYLGANMLGGILLSESRPASEEQDYSSQLSSNSSFIESPASQLIKNDTEYASYDRIAAHVTNSSRVRITNNSFGGENHGLVIDGENSSQHFLAENSITGVSECVRVEKSTGDTLYAVNVNNSKGNGFVFVETQNTRFLRAVSEYCKGIPFLLDRCKDIVISDSRFVSSISNEGISISDSDKVILRSIKIQDMSGIGVSMHNSKNVELDRVDIVRGTTGIFAYRCEDVAILGHPVLLNDPDQFNKAISSINGPAIDIWDSKRVQIGSANHYLRLFRNDMQGIKIQGNDTASVRITGCLIYQNKQEGIRIEGGKEITIGGTQSQDVNYIYNNQQDGILAQGTETDVSVLNNQIGITELNAPYFNEQNGIVLQGGIRNVLISGNNICYNQQNGILVKEGAHHNQIAFNSIANNSLNGIKIESNASVANQITRNSITRNYQSGIKLLGGNNSIPAPSVDVMMDKTDNLIGHIDAPDGSIVEIFSDLYDEGEKLIAAATVRFKNFVTAGNIPIGQNVHATITNPDGNTSEFGNSTIVDQRNQENQTYVFSSDSFGQKDVFIKRPTQKNPERLTDDPSADEEPQISSNGRYIVFTSSRSGNREIWVMSNTGQNLTPVASDSAADYKPAWQPGGDQVLFVSERDGNPEIYCTAVNPDAIQGEIGPGEKTLDTSNPGYAGKTAGDAAAVRFNSMAGVLSHFLIYITADPVPFSWKVIPYENNKPGSTVIAEGTAKPDKIGWNIVETGKIMIPADYLIAVYYLEADKPKVGLSHGGLTYRWWTYSTTKNLWISENYIPFMIRAFVQPPDPARLTANNASDTEPAWSPDQKQIVFTSNRDGNSDLWIMNPDGSNPKKLTDGKGKNTKAAWSPDGKKIAFVSDRDGNLEIYTILPDGTGIERITNHPGIDTDPAWNKTGDRLFFSSNRVSGMEIYSLALKNPQPSRLTVTAGNSVEPHASINQISGLALTTDLVEENLTNKKPIRDTVNPLSVPCQLIVSSGKGKNGEQAPVEIRLDGVESVGNIAFDIQYNPIWLHLADIPLDGLSINPLYALNSIAIPPEGSVRFNSVYTNGLTGSNMIMKLLFDIDRNAPSSQELIAIKNLYGYSIQYAGIQVVPQDGSIQIVNDNTRVPSWMLY